MSVYKAIAAVMGDLAQTGISKSRKNQQQGYTFRGIDDLYNALAPLLAKHGLVILPRVISRDCIERQTAKGNALLYVTVKCEFDFVSADDGSSHCVTTFGEAMDSADKATNKAMSAALKYACLQTFMVPTEGDNDADATTHEVRGRDKQPDQFTHDPATVGRLKTAKTVEELTQAWKDIPVNLRARYTQVKDARKAELGAA
jgi:hypothetical protein